MLHVLAPAAPRHVLCYVVVVVFMDPQLVLQTILICVTGPD